MSLSMDDMKEHLEEQLKRSDITKEDRTSIEGVLSFFEKEKRNHKKQWEKITQYVKNHTKKWEEKYPIEGYHYEVYLVKNQAYRDAVLMATSDNHEDEVWSVVLYEKNGELYFESIRKELNDVRLETFDDIKRCIEKTFDSQAFQTFKKHMERI